MHGDGGLAMIEATEITTADGEKYIVEAGVNRCDLPDAVSEFAIQLGDLDRRCDLCGNSIAEADAGYALEDDDEEQI
jgi:hypothetical protein